MHPKEHVANFSVRLPGELLTRLNHLSKTTHRPKSYYVIEALAEHIENMEDYYLALERLTNKNAEYLNSEEARKYLEL